MAPPERRKGPRSFCGMAKVSRGVRVLKSSIAVSISLLEMIFRNAIEISASVTSFESSVWCCDLSSLRLLIRDMAEPAAGL